MWCVACSLHLTLDQRFPDLCSRIRSICYTSTSDRGSCINPLSRNNEGHRHWGFFQLACWNVVPRISPRRIVTLELLHHVLMGQLSQSSDFLVRKMSTTFLSNSAIDNHACFCRGLAVGSVASCLFHTIPSLPESMLRTYNANHDNKKKCRRASTLFPLIVKAPVKSRLQRECACVCVCVSFLWVTSDQGNDLRYDDGLSWQVSFMSLKGSKGSAVSCRCI